MNGSQNVERETIDENSTFNLVEKRNLVYHIWAKKSPSLIVTKALVQWEIFK